MNPTTVLSEVHKAGANPVRCKFEGATFFRAGADYNSVELEAFNVAETQSLTTHPPPSLCELEAFNVAETGVETVLKAKSIVNFDNLDAFSLSQVSLDILEDDAQSAVTSAEKNP